MGFLTPETIIFAVLTRLELATPCVTGRYSNQLNYNTKFCGASWTRTNNPLVNSQVL